MQRPKGRERSPDPFCSTKEQEGRRGRGCRVSLGRTRLRAPPQARSAACIPPNNPLQRGQLRTRVRGQLALLPQLCPPHSSRGEAGAGTEQGWQSCTWGAEDPGTRAQNGREGIPHPGPRGGPSASPVTWANPEAGRGLLRGPRVPFGAAPSVSPLERARSTHRAPKMVRVCPRGCVQRACRVHL